jgi:multidrug efflux system membrane fusion protein
MGAYLKGHTVAALAVLIAAGIWVGTGEFTSVGSRQTLAFQQQPEAGAAAVAVAAAPEAPGLRVVATIVPRFEDHARVIRLSGVTQPEKRAVLAARTSGVVETLTVVKGATVDAEAVVMTLEGADILATVNIAEIAYDQRRRELDTAEKLFAGGNRTETQVLAARSAEATAAAQLNQSRAAADRLTLQAPFAGVVDTVNVEPGEWIQTGTPVATVLSLDPIEVRAEVSELYVDYLRPGADALLTLANGVQVHGTVSFVSKEASAQTRTFPVEITLPNPQHAIAAGMTAEVTLFADPIRAVTVPRSVITLSDAGEIGLRVVGTDNVARFAAVDMIDDKPEGLVLTGVPADVRIIVAGQDLVRDGETVTAVDASPVAAEPAAAVTE